MKTKNKIRVLGAGLGITLLCCFTPVLVVLLGFFGLSAFTGYLDYGLTPLLGFFITALTVVLFRQYKNKYLLYLGGIILLGFAVLYLR